MQYIWKANKYPTAKAIARLEAQLTVTNKLSSFPTIFFMLKSWNK